MTLTLAVGVRAARVRHRPHRAAVHRVRADAGRRGAGLGLRRADADADDVLAAAARTRRKHSWIYNRIEARVRRADQRLPARCSPRRCTRAGSSALGWVVDARRSARCSSRMLKSELVADRGPRRRLRPRHRAAGLDAAVHGRPAASRSRSSTRRSRRRPRTRRSPGFPTVVDGNAVLRLKPWEERTRKQQQIADELRPKFAAIPGALAFPINPPSLGQSFRSTPIEYVIMSQVPYAELQRIVDRFLDEARKYPGRAEPADRPAAQHARGARQHQPRQARRHRHHRRHRRPHAGDDARRPPGHALQARRRAVRRDRAGRAARPHDAGRHQRHLRARARRQHGAARPTWSTCGKASRRSRSTTSTGCAR